MGNMNLNHRAAYSRGRRKGFTLLELLVVVGILATLVALALPYYQDYINQSRITAAKADLTTFAKALNLNDLFEPSVATQSDFRPLIGKYMQDFRTSAAQTMPVDPWGGNYVLWPWDGYIVCAGPDGVVNTSSNSSALISPQNDDILQQYKTPYYISSVRALSNTKVEVQFSRRVMSSTVANDELVVDGTNTSNMALKISDTIFHFVLPTALTTGNHTAVVGSVTALDYQTAYQLKPDGSAGNTVTFKYPN